MCSLYFTEEVTVVDQIVLYFIRVVEFLPLFCIHVIIQSIFMYISHNIFVMILKSLKIKICLLIVISLAIGYVSFYWFT